MTLKQEKESKLPLKNILKEMLNLEPKQGQRRKYIEWVI
jgi:hypothetical protein